MEVVYRPAPRSGYRTPAGTAGDVTHCRLLPLDASTQRLSSGILVIQSCLAVAAGQEPADVGAPLVGREV